MRCRLIVTESISTLNEESLGSDPRELVRRMVEDTLNGLLNSSLGLRIFVVQSGLSLGGRYSSP